MEGREVPESEGGLLIPFLSAEHPNWVTMPRNAFLSTRELLLFCNSVL